jgi:hypothetical protein
MTAGLIRQEGKELRLLHYTAFAVCSDASGPHLLFYISWFLRTRTTSACLRLSAQDNITFRIWLNVAFEKR